MATPNPATAASATSQDALHALLREILPPQGAWSDEEYLWLTDRCNHPIEFTDGHVQELPLPTFTHQAILAFLYRLFHAYVAPRGGLVMFSALRMRIREGKFREPDLLLPRDRSAPRCQDRYWLGADLVVEVVSPDDPDRDLVEKRADYAEAGIPGTGSSTPATRRSRCSLSKATPTSSMASSPPATPPCPACSTDSPPT